MNGFFSEWTSGEFAKYFEKYSISLQLNQDLDWKKELNSRKNSIFNSWEFLQIANVFVDSFFFLLCACFSISLNSLGIPKQNVLFFVVMYVVRDRRIKNLFELWSIAANDARTRAHVEATPLHYLVSVCESYVQTGLVLFMCDSRSGMSAYGKKRTYFLCLSLRLVCVFGQIARMLSTLNTIYRSHYHWRIQRLPDQCILLSSLNDAWTEFLLKTTGSAFIDTNWLITYGRMPYHGAIDINFK